MKQTIISLLAGGFLGLTALAAPDDFASPTISIGVVVYELQESLEFYTQDVGMT